MIMLCHSDAAVEVFPILMYTAVTNECATIIYPQYPELAFVISLIAMSQCLYILTFVCIYTYNKCPYACSKKSRLQLIICTALMGLYFFFALILIMVLSFAQNIDFVDDPPWETITICNSYLAMLFVSQSVLFSMGICNGGVYIIYVYAYYKDHRPKEQVI